MHSLPQHLAPYSEYSLSLCPPASKTAAGLGHRTPLTRWGVTQGMTPMGKEQGEQSRQETRESSDLPAFLPQDFQSVLALHHPPLPPHTYAAQLRARFPTNPRPGETSPWDDPFQEAWSFSFKSKHQRSTAKLC